MKSRVMKKVLALLLGTAMTAGMLTGCGNSAGGQTASADTAESSEAGEASAETDAGDAAADAAGIDTSEHVDLKLYLVGDKNEDFDEVWAKINETLEEKLNATLNVEYLGWGEQDTKYSLLFSSGEDFDLIFTGSMWMHWEETVSLGGFYPMTEEFIQTYAPDIWEVLPENAWEQATLNGEIYMVPAYGIGYKKEPLAVRGDLMEKYGIEQITNWDELVDFYMACAADGIYGCRETPWLEYCRQSGLYAINGAPLDGELVTYNVLDPEDLTLNYILDWDGFADYCKLAKEMADAGVWSKDVLNTNDEQQTGLLTGKAATMTGGIDVCRTYANQANEENPDWNVVLADPDADHPKKILPYTNEGIGINVNSKNKERAMMVLNELYTNPELYDTAMLGIEGKHWEAVGDDQYKILDNSGWIIDVNIGWGNYTIQRTEYIENRTAVDDACDEMKETWNSNLTEDHPYDSFNFVSDNVSSQYAAVEAVLGTYFDPLVNGLVDDVDASIAELNAALEGAGIRDVLAEMERQAAEYVAE